MFNLIRRKEAIMIRRKRLFTDEEIDKIGVLEKDMRATWPVDEIYRLRFYITHEKPLRQSSYRPEHRQDVKRFREDKQQIIQWYKEEIKTVLQLSKEYKVARQAIYNVLNKAGVVVSPGQRVRPTVCSTCNKSLTVHLCRIKKQKRHFCNRTCYIAWMEALGDGYQDSRQGQRLSRRIVAQYIELKPGYIVHHEDKQCWNFQAYNLRVFKSQADHVRYHRGFDVQPIWDGSLI